MSITIDVIFWQLKRFVQQVQINFTHVDDTLLEGSE